MGVYMEANKEIVWVVWHTRYAVSTSGKEFIWINILDDEGEMKMVIAFDQEGVRRISYLEPQKGGSIYVGNARREERGSKYNNMGFDKIERSPHVIIEKHLAQQPGHWERAMHDKKEGDICWPTRRNHGWN